MKRQTAREILVQSFHEIAQKKTVDKITVREITENCGYSLATFYRQSIVLDAGALQFRELFLCAEGIPEKPVFAHARTRRFY